MQTSGIYTWNPTGGDGSGAFEAVEADGAGALLINASPDGKTVTQHDSTDDPNGPFVGMRFDAAGTVILNSGGAPHTLTVLAGEYWPGTVTRIDSTSTTLTNAQMTGFKRA